MCRKQLCPCARVQDTVPLCGVQRTRVQDTHGCAQGMCRVVYPCGGVQIYDPN